MSRIGRWVALLRGINVGGRTLPMAELRSACEEIGWSDVRTYIQSGNIVFEAEGDRPDVERALEERIRSRFGLAVPVVARSVGEWAEYLTANPFPVESGAEPKQVHLGLSKEWPRLETAETLRSRAQAGERIEVVGDALWIHFPAGVGVSKLTPDVLNRAAGSPVTLRNWRTIVAIDQLLRGS